METSTTTKFLMGTTLVLLLGGCHQTNPTSPAPTPPPQTAAAVTLTTTIVDSATSVPITDPTLMLTIYSGSTTTVVAGPLANSASGVFTYVPTVTPPVTYRLVATANNYTTVSQYVTIAATSVTSNGAGHVAANMKLVQVTAAPTAAAAATSAPVTVTNGVTPTAVSTATTTTAAVVGTASATVPAGTQVTTATGTPLTGATTLSVTYNPATTAAALATYPASTFAFVTASGAASSTPISLVTAGGLSASMTDASGNQATTFSTPITLTGSVPATTINPNTGTHVNRGDTIPIWFFGTNGILQPLTNASGPVTGTVGALDPTGQFYPVTFQTTHFCWFSWAWTLPAANSANTNMTVTGYTGTVTGYATDAYAGWYDTFQLDANSPTITLFSVPSFAADTAGPSVTLVINGTVAKTQSFTPGTAFTVDLSGTTAVAGAITATFNINGICPNSTATFGLASLPVIAQGTTAKNSVVTAVSDVNGLVTLAGLLPSTNYTLTVPFGSTIGQTTKALPFTTPATNPTGGYALPAVTYNVACGGTITGLTGAGN